MNVLRGNHRTNDGFKLEQGCESRMKIPWLIFVAVLVGLAPGVKACQCIEAGPVCQSYFTTPVVFAGEVVSIENLPDPSTPKIQIVGWDRYAVHFAVSEAFRGVSGAEVAVRAGGGCSYNFELGRKYLVYADSGEAGGPLHAYICGRSAPIEKAQADIDFIHGLKTAAGAEIHGSITAARGSHTMKELVAKQSVTIFGESGAAVHIKTDESGMFRVAGLSLGKYTVTAATIPGQTEFSAWHGTMFDGSCAAVDFYSVWDGRVGGHVRDFAGQPVADISVTLAEALGPAKTFTPIGQVTTDEDGAYQFREVQPGAYTIEVNDQGWLKRAAYSTVFYPSAISPKDAQTVSVGEASVKDGVDVTMPAPAERALVEKWRGIVGDARGRVGVAAVIVESEEIAELNATAHFPMQSVYKLPIAMAVLQLVDAGKISLEQSVEVRPADYVPAEKHSPLRDEFPGGTRKTVRELVRYAITESDGSASDILLRMAGGPAAVTKYLRGIGVSDLVVKNSEMEMTWTTQYENWSTPRAAVQVLLMLQREHGVSEASRDLLLKDMRESATGATRIRSLLPKGTNVADKTGSSGMQNGRAAATNDIALVTLPDGRHMAIAIFVADSEAADAVRDAVIAKIGLAAWEEWK
jgi:beta-lactamase class A